MGDFTRTEQVPLVGRFGRPATLVNVTLTVDAGGYTAADLLSDRVLVANAFDLVNGIGLLQSVTLLDEADQGAALDLVFLDADVSLGTINSAPNISDANARNILTKVPVATGDYVDLGGSKLAALGNLNRIVKAVSGTRDLYVAAINGAGTPTYAAATDIKLRLGIVSL